MFDSLLGFRNEEERNDFLIALPVLAFFGCLLFWFTFDGDQFFKQRYAAITAAPADAEAVTAADLDGDLVADGEDHCTSAAGTVANFGCPEADDSATNADQAAVDAEPEDVAQEQGLRTQAESDAIPAADSEAESTAEEDVADEDAVEEPATPEVVDSDGDGVNDDSDLCPQEPGESENSGCPPDSDNDGVADPQDLCPQSKGVAENRGCPADSDADGLPDDQDECPQQSGTLESGGCPVPIDSDNDGFEDSQDECPQQAGSADNQGCPADSDSDGIADEDDNCPDIAGSGEQQGCPAEEKPESPPVTSIGSGITFETASATLTGESRKLLDAVARILEKYPSVKLTVEGHTDDSGDAAINLQLSTQRARACTSYLARKGIAAERMSAIGFGETRPLVANDSADARKRNRRVEFKLSY